MTHTFVIGLGANLGDRLANLQAAIDALATTPGVEVLAVSFVYESDAVGPPQPGYLNAAVRVGSALDPEALLDAALAIESGLGRVRRERWGPRTIDLDILTSDAGPYASPRLSVPHPELGERPFAIAPVLDVLPTPDPGLVARLAALGGPPARTADRLVLPRSPKDPATPRGQPK